MHLIIGSTRVSLARILDADCVCTFICLAFLIVRHFCLFPKHITVRGRDGCRVDMASSEFCETVMRDEEYFVISFRHRTPQEIFASVTLNSVALYKVKFELFLIRVSQNTIAYVGPFQYVPRYAVFNDPSARTLREFKDERPILRPALRKIPI